MDNDLKYNIITAIAYNRIVSRTFTPGECICLHQWKNQGIEPNAVLRDKFSKVMKMIKQENWQRPELRYDEGLQLYYECPDTLLWKKVTNN